VSRNGEGGECITEKLQEKWLVALYHKL